MFLEKQAWFFLVFVVCSANASTAPDTFSSTSEPIETTTALKKPTEPQNFIATAQTFKSIVLSWDEPSEWNGDAIGYDLTVNIGDNQEVFSLRIRGRNNLKFKVTDLAPETNYTLRLRAVSEASGKVIRSDAALLVTQTVEVRYPTVVRNLQLVSRYPTNVTLGWDEPEQWNGPQEGYQVNFSSPSAVDIYYLTGKDNRSFTYETNNSTNYSAYIYAFTTYNGQRMIGDPATLYLPSYTRRPPSQPLNFRIVTQNTRTASLVWDQPLNWNGDICGYNITFSEESGPNLAVELKGKGNTHFYASELTPERLYKFTLYAFNLIEGTKRYSDPVLLDVRTFPPERPPMPEKLEVSSITTRSLVITWNKVREFEIDGYIVTHVTSEEAVKDVVTENRIQLTNLSPWTYYVITVSSFKGNGSKKIKSEPALITVQTNYSVPSPPVSPSVEDVQGTSLTLKWKAPLVRNGPIQGYLVYLSDDTGTVTNITTTKPSHTFVRLEPWTEYKFNITAYNSISNPEMISEPISLSAKTDVLAPGEAESLTVYEVTNSSFKVKWDKPKVTNGPLSGYRVIRKDVKTGEEVNVTTSLTNCTFKDLKAWTTYNVTVESYNTAEKDPGNNLYGPPAIESQMTNVSTPSVPTNVKVGNITNSTIEVMWGVPEEPNGPITGYKVHVPNDTQGTFVNDTYVRIENLRPWTNYTIDIQAYNTEGKNFYYSEPAVLQDSTSASAPGEVESLSIYEVSNSSLEVSWSKPKVTNGPLSGYRVICKDANTGEQMNVTTFLTNCTFKDLKAWTTYNVTVEAYNTVEEDPAKNLYGPPAMDSQTTNVSTPSVPTNVMVGNITNSTIEVMWDVPEEANGPIMGYKVEFRNDTQAVYVNVTYVRLENLIPWTNYTIDIQAYNTEGNISYYSESAVLQNSTSASAPPYAASTLSVASTDKVSATLKFPPHLFSNDYGNIVEYILLVAASSSQDNTQEKGYDSLNETGFINWKESTGTKEWYRSSHKNWDIDTDKSICSTEDGQRKCVIGADKTCNDKEKFCDAPLNPETQYWAKIRAYTIAGWTETFPVSFKTEGNGCGIHTPTIVLFILALMSFIL